MINKYIIIGLSVGIFLIVVAVILIVSWRNNVAAEYAAAQKKKKQEKALRTKAFNAKVNKTKDYLSIYKDAAANAAIVANAAAADVVTPNS